MSDDGAVDGGALRRSEERFRLLVESVTEYAIFMLDTQGHVESWNAGAERIKGYDEDEIIGQHFSTFYRREDRARGTPDRLLQVAREEGHVEAQGWRVRKDGSLFWADVVITALRDDDGTLVGFAKVTRDMTDVHKARAAREDAAHQRRALERLQELDSWRREFVSSIAHDLQTPVTAITGFADILQDEELERSERDELLGRITANARALEELIVHLRTFAWLESGRLEIDPVELDLSTEVHEVVKRMGPVLSGRPVELELEGIVVLADQRGLHRILQNLLSNAARHAPPDEPITVRATEEDGDVVVEVVDRGEGIPEDVLPTVFDRYRRGWSGGTGLGLSIVKQYVELHGGGVGVESVPGEGATFRFTLPPA